MKTYLSPKLQTYLRLSLPLFILHGVEEYMNGFYIIDESFLLFSKYFSSMSIDQATFLLYQILLWLMIFIFLVVVTTKKGVRYMLIILGIVFVGESYHLMKVILSGSYYPGAISALLFPLLGYFYRKEIIRQKTSG